ncbi:adenosine deaminase [Stappia taiwanensis]|uniref:Adenine deaminase n=1 Tax=Stappia taiwanensis TaxID=992267 RepID=A0A838XWB4_9HYPH|nr:adenosine deaminase [Stappia taiwanensis]MBA4612786.1 adenosine deaminase [Stappia taiwanensis]GGE90081.1 adenine deaminase [Stappia taiwanensis]
MEAPLGRGPLPKAELHVHVEGAAPPDLVRRLAEKYSVDIGGLFNEDGGYDWQDFSSFLAVYDKASRLFRAPEDYALLSETYLRQLAAEGAIYAELTISPDHAAGAGLSYAAYVGGLAEGIERARAETGIEARMIAIGVRHFGAQAVERVALQVTGAPHPLVTGFGLAGDEREGHPASFARAFRIAGEAGLGLTAHAGEFAGPESVAAALDFLKVRRIGHGVRAIEDPALVERLAAEGIVLEVCPGSNLALGLYGALRFHPVNLLRRAGCRITLNSDDPPFFRTTLGQEYASCAEVFGWSREDLIAITGCAIDAAFCDDETRAALRRRLPAVPAQWQT